MLEIIDERKAGSKKVKFENLQDGSIIEFSDHILVMVLGGGIYVDLRAQRPLVLKYDEDKSLWTFVEISSVRVDGKENDLEVREFPGIAYPMFEMERYFHVIPSTITLKVKREEEGK